ncbi:MAG: DUF3256 family protein [Bacteroidaceae bacterium]|nr:DUF3256 family protein [Bacteroidaceae bacterium]
MKPSVILISLFLSFAAALQAQTDVERFFVSWPDSCLPVLSRQARAELIQLSRQGAEAVVENLFGLPSHLMSHTDRYISVSLTPASRLEICVLPTDTTPLFCVVHTLLKPAPQSRLQFFFSNGREATSVFEMPDLGEFLTAPDSTIYLERKHWSKILLPLHIEAQWENQGQVLSLQVHTQGLSLEDRRGAETAFRRVRLRWVGGRWERV